MPYSIELKTLKGLTTVGDIYVDDVDTAILLAIELLRDSGVKGKIEFIAVK